MARLKDLVKTYRLINDPKSPDWNVKFAAALFAVALAALALAAVAFMPKAGDPAAPQVAANTAPEDAPPDTLTEYVGADLGRLDPAQLPSEETVRAQLDAWRAAHPDATILGTEPVTVGGRVVGYTIVYRP